MNATTTLDPTPVRATEPAPTEAGHVGFGTALRAEWHKLRSVRSTWWTIGSLFVLGAGLTVLICGLNAEWLAGPDGDESPGSFITWGMMLAPVCAVVLGALMVTSEYSTGMIRSTFAAMPNRGTVFAAKAVLLSVVLFVVGTAAAFVGYLGGNYFLDREGIGIALEGDMLRALYGSGLFMAGIGLMSAGVGWLVRHTAGTISSVLAVLMVIGNMVALVPGTLGDWLMKAAPGNAGGAIATPVPFNPEILDAWPGFGVFAAEVALVLGFAYLAVRRRDA